MASGLSSKFLDLSAVVIKHQKAKLNSDNGAVVLRGQEVKTDATKTNIFVGDSLEYKTDASRKGGKP